MYEKYNSAVFPSIEEEVVHANSNPITISALSEPLIYDGVGVGSPTCIFEDYVEFAYENSIDIIVSEELQYRPEAFSEALYGTPDLFYTIMIMNGILSLNDFKAGRTVTVLDPSSDLLDQIIANHIKKINMMRENPRIIEDLTIKQIL